jgi:hypothetical protein
MKGILALSKNRGKIQFQVQLLKKRLLIAKRPHSTRPPNAHRRCYFQAPTAWVGTKITRDR